jgi:Ca2+-binding EF-hand superfamily protein
MQKENADAQKYASNMFCKKSETLYARQQQQKFNDIFKCLDGDKDGKISLKAI